MASSRTPNQEKALKWYGEKYQLRPQLSAHPVYYFVEKSSGNHITRNILHITREWDDDRQASKRRNSGKLA